MNISIRTKAGVLNPRHTSDVEVYCVDDNGVETLLKNVTSCVIVMDGHTHEVDARIVIRGPLVDLRNLVADVQERDA